jgi:hypothetical protein
MQFLYSLFLAVGGIAMIVWSKTLAVLMYERNQRPLRRIFTGNWKLPDGPIGNFFTKIGTYYLRSLIPINFLGFIFAGIVLLLMAYAVSFGPIVCGN